MPRREEFVASLHSGEADTVLPMLELLTEGLLASPEMLEEYVRFLDGSTSSSTAHEPQLAPQ